MKNLLKCLIIAGVCLSPSDAMSQEKLEKKVVDIVKQTGDLYKGAKNMRAEGIIESKVMEDGADQTVKIAARFDVEKPNRFAVRTQIDGDANKGPDLICDGKRLTVHAKARKQYTEESPPSSLGDIGMTLLRMGPMRPGMLFANILADDPADLLMQGVTACTYVGTEKLDGTPVHRMKFSQPEFDWELWVAAEGKPYILRMVSAGDGPEGKFNTTETYKNWKLDTEMPKDAFTFEAPKEATKVKSFNQ